MHATPDAPTMAGCARSVIVRVRATAKAMEAAQNNGLRTAPSISRASHPTALGAPTAAPSPAALAAEGDGPAETGAQSNAARTTVSKAAEPHAATT